MMPSAIDGGWKEIYEARYAWAFRAYEAFVASLSEEVRQRFVSKDEERVSEAFVVVFGKTQVGKTTLLLELMGVSMDAMSRVTEVLRGGRKEGFSATATTMEYGRSLDDRWGLSVKRNMQCFRDDAGMTQALGNLRQAMQTQQLDVDGPCVVLIPQCCFGSDNEKLQIRMLDLPGDKPGNAVEQAHVKAMAEKYVRQADLILLVGRGDDLGFLKPGELTLPGIEDWRIVPDRFRVVTTYSFAAKSLRDVVRKQADPLEPEWFRMRLVEQIEKFGVLHVEAKKSRRFFPLEFGNSWRDTEDTDPALHQQVSPLIQQFKHQLHADILASTTPLARLKNAMLAHLVVAQVRNSRLGVIRGEREGLEHKLADARKECNQIKKLVRSAEGWLKDSKESLKLLTDEKLARDLEVHFAQAGAAHLFSPDETVSGLKLMVNDAKALLRKSVIESRPWHDVPANQESKARSIFWRQLKVDMHEHDSDIHRLLDRKFKYIVDKLNGYLLDRYWRTEDYGCDYQEDRRTFAANLEDAEKLLLTKVRDWWLLAAKQKREEMAGEHMLHQGSHKRRKSSMKSQQRVVSALVKEHESCQEGQEAFEERMGKELDESRRFKQLMDEGYLAELRKRREALDRDRSPSRRLIELLGAVHLSEVRGKLATMTGEVD